MEHTVPMEHRRHGDRRSIRRILGTLAAASVVALGVVVPMQSAVAAPIPAPGPVLLVDSHALDFGYDAVGVPSAPQVVNVINRGTSAITIATIVADAIYPITTTCGASVAAKASCTISVVHDPAVAGFAGGTLQIATLNAGSVNVALSGSGGAPPGGAGLVVTPQSIDFGSIPVGQTTTRTVIYRNEGNASVVGLLPTASTSPFPYTTTCGSQLDPGISCFFSITYSPTTTASVTAQLEPMPGAPASVIASLGASGLPAVDAADVAYVTPKGTPLVVSDPNAGFVGLSSGYVVDFVSAVAPTTGTLATSPNGTWTFSPAAGFSGPVTFNYTVEDYFGLTAVGTMSITVSGAALAVTGADVLPTVMTAAGLLAAGFVLTFIAARARRQRAAHRRIG